MSSEDGRTEHQSEVAEFLYFLALTIAICFITLLDVAHFTLYLGYWLPTTVAVALPIYLYLSRSSRVRLALLGLLIGWILILPYIRWDRTKSFFVDAHRLQVGMTIVQARSVMEPYLEFEDGNSIRFKPSEGGGDMCLVYLKDDKIVQIEISID